MNRLIDKIIGVVLTTAMLNLCWMTSFGWAEIAVTDSVVAVSMQISADREKIRALLNRKDAQHQLEQYGITQEEVVNRINSLTDAEVAALVAQVDQLPAGGNLAAAAEATVYAALLALVLVIYLLAVLFRGIECIFSDCEAKGGLSYVFGPLRKDKNSQSIEYEEGEDDCDPGMESCI